MFSLVNIYTTVLIATQNLQQIEELRQQFLGLVTHSLLTTE